MFDGILKEVSENGKGLVFLNNTPYNPFNEAAGIIKTGKIIERSYLFYGKESITKEEYSILMRRFLLIKQQEG